MDERLYVVVPVWNGISDLPAFLESFRATTLLEEVKLVVVDNASSDESLSYIRAHYPEAYIIANTENRGFAGGCNQGMQYALNEGAEYVMLANQDLVFQANWKAPLLAALKNDASLGVVQSLMLQGDGLRVNSDGNALHYLGYGFSRGNGVLLSEWRTRNLVGEVPFFYCSGGAVVFSAEALRKVGLFDEFYFMYHEDTDLCWRMRLAGYSLAVVQESVVWHRYEFSRSIKKFIDIERNRLITIIKNYQLATLVLVMPMLLVAEVGQILASLPQALRNTAVIGASEKLKSYRFFFSLRNWRVILAARRAAQSLRQVSDRNIVAHLSDVVEFQGSDSRVVSIANVLTRTYWRIVRPLIVW